MRVRREKRTSLYFESFLLLVISGVISVLFFLIINGIIEEQIERVWSDRNLVKHHNEANIKDLQTYVSINKVKSTDQEAIAYWCDQYRHILLQVMDGDELLYSSEDGVDDIEKASEIGYDIPPHDADSYFTVAFADGTKDVFIMGMYSYGNHMAAIIMEIVSSFLLFFLLIMFGFRRKISYINQLSKDVLILEGGELNYAVKLQGNDEITDLAECINSMRVSLNQQMQETERALRTNQQMVTEISHDLRTPLTSILLYAEILQNDRLSDEKQRAEYLEKMVKKVEHMKSLSDHLLEYSLDANTPSDRESEPEWLSCKQVLFDELSDMCTYLEAHTYQIWTDMKWQDGKILVKEEYLARILDNVSSNILKYASNGEKVKIWDVYECDRMKLIFENAYADEEQDVDTHGVGLQSIRSMLRDLGGSCIVLRDQKCYRICLEFCYQE